MSIFNFQAKWPKQVASSIIEFAKSVFSDFGKDKIGQKAASLTYYTLFSLAPFLILIIFLGGLFLEKQNLQAAILERLASTTGPQTRDMVAQIINQTQSGNNGLVFSILASFGILLGASGLISNFEEMVNSLWGIEKKLSWLQTIRRKLIGFGVVLVLVILAILLSLSNFVLNYLGLSNFIGLSNFSSLLLTALALSVVFKILIHRKISWKSLIIGSLASSFLLAILRLVLQIYFSQSSFMSLYSAGGALVILLLWLNYNLQIIFLGLEITKNYQKKQDTSNLSVDIFDQPVQ